MSNSGTENYGGAMRGPVMLLNRNSPLATFAPVTSAPEESETPAAAEPWDVNLAEEAAKLWKTLLNRDTSARPFDTKWNDLRALEPGLLVLMARMTDAEAQQRLANRRPGHEADLAGRRFGALMNRARALEGIPEAELDRVIRQREPEVFAAMQVQHERRKSNFPLHTPSWGKHIQQSLAREAAKMPGASFEQIWQAWKRVDLDSFEMLVAMSD